MKRFNWFLAISFTVCILFSLTFCGSGADDQGTDSEISTEAAAGPDLENSNWFGEVSARIASEEYRIREADEGFQAVNRKQGFHAMFNAEGLSIIDRLDEAEWSWTWQTVRFGRNQNPLDVDLVEPALSGCDEEMGPGTEERCSPLLEYEQSKFVEWYANRMNGIEQGFEIQERPYGDGLLVIEGSVDTELTGRLEEGGDKVIFSLDGQDVLQYSSLSVTDAVGQKIPAWMEFENSSLRLVIDDSGAVYPLSVDPKLFTTPAWTAETNQAAAWFGYSVSSAGDVNGDGYYDVIVGAHCFDNGETEEGRAYVYHGSVSGLATAPAWIAEGNKDSAWFGYSVSFAGDVNGDGYDDVIVGAPGFSNGQNEEGRAYVYYGAASGLAATPAWAAESNQSDAHFGLSVSFAGDINGDGYGDVIVGSPFFNNGQNEEGRAYVFHGTASGLAVMPAWAAESNQPDARFGLSVSSAGDVNGDGYDDVIVGAYQFGNGETYEGRAYVYHGAASGLAATPAWTAESNQSYTEFGKSVSSAGDVNNDGYDDVIIGAPDYNNGQNEAGRAYVYHGASSGLAATPAWTAESNQYRAFFGQSVSSAGDVNSDGYDDVIVGADFFNNGEEKEGRAYVFHGASSGLAATPAWTAESNQEYACFGTSVSSAGDVNGDGYDDVIVGERGNQAYVFHGPCLGGCEIGGNCYSSGDTNPQNVCLVCDPARNGEGWSDNDGASCDDGMFCNGTDTCSLDACTVHSGDPCTEDSKFCNGNEYCDESAKRCMHSGTPCPDNGIFCDGVESCNESKNECEQSGNPCDDDGLWCNGEEFCKISTDQCAHTGSPCTDDGLFCNGEEVCYEPTHDCIRSGNPCSAGEYCDEEEDLCDSLDDTSGGGDGGGLSGCGC